MSRFLLLALALIGCRKDNPDIDGDGADNGDDCAPYDPAVSPESAEVCNGQDDDCDGSVDDGVGSEWFADADGDGFGDDAAVTNGCFEIPGTATIGGDCDDADPRRHPGAAESCTDAADFDCDGAPGATDGDGDGVAACEDCDDDDDTVFAGAPETCDGDDDDCDGSVDEDATDAATFYADLDGDGHGSDRFTADACAAPDGFTDSDDDCNDLDPTAFPGAPEACDGVDDDCDGTIDDGVTGVRTWYADADGDGHGDPDAPIEACLQPAAAAAEADDCDDADALAHPGADESCTDTKDRNCDGSTGATDADGDGTKACDDCDDSRADVEPGATEGCDGADNDCDGAIDESPPSWYPDFDGDGHGSARFAVAACVAPPGYVAAGDDCDDLRATVRPGATEACDGADTDCAGGAGSGEVDADADGVLVCAGDCNDASAAVRPGVVETCNDADDDCDGSKDDAAIDATAWYTDADADGYGAGKATFACATPSGAVDRPGDCNDNAASTNPGAPELCATVGVDDDCDGSKDEAGAPDAKVWFADADGDGHGAAGNFVIACTAPSGRVAVGDDCADGNKNVFPGATEACNGVDDNCDGKVASGELDDSDQDGTPDCADVNSAIRLDGAGDFVVIPGTATSLALSGPATIELWFKTTANVGSEVAFVGKHQCGLSSGYFIGINSYSGRSNVAQWYYGTDPRLSAFQSMNDGQWHHVAGTWNGSGTMRLYVDGVEVGNKSSSFTTNVAYDVILGGHGLHPSCGAQGNFNGVLDEVSIWSVERTPAQILADQSRAVSPSETGLLVYYNFDEASGQTVVDRSPNGRNGLLGATSAAEATDPTRVVDGPFMP